MSHPLPLGLADSNLAFIFSSCLIFSLFRLGVGEFSKLNRSMNNRLQNPRKLVHKGS